MNKPFAILLALLLASPLVVLGLAVMGLTGDFSEEVPVWRAGDSWQYDDKTTVRASGSVLGLGSADAGAIVLQTTRAMTVMNTSHTVSDLPVYAVSHSGDFKSLTFGGNSLGLEGGCTRTAEGMDCDGDVPAEMVDEFDMGPCFTGCGIGFLGFYTQEDLALVIPDDPVVTVKTLDFPLTKGKTWTIIGAPVPFEGTDEPFAIVAEAVEEEYIKLDGIGAIEAIRVDFRLSEATEAAIERAFVGAATGEGASGVDFDFSFSGSTWYSPEHRNIVQTLTDTMMTTRGSHSGFTASAKVTIELDQVMTGHAYTPMAERPIREAERIAELPLTSDTPKDTKIASQPWFFSVAASALSLDATSGEEVTLGLTEGWATEDVETEDFTTPPEGRVTWTHRYVEAGKPRIERGEGPTITTAITEPGLHVFTARAYDGDGRLLGADDIILEGYTKTQVSFDDLAGAQTERMAAIPVVPGALFGRLHDTSDGTLIGRLVLLDAEGETVAEKSNQFASTDELHDLTRFTPGEWRFGYEIDAIAGRVDATLEIHYLDRAGDGGWTMDDNLLPCAPPLCDVTAAGAVPSGTTGIPGLPDLGLMKRLAERFV